MEIEVNEYVRTPIGIFIISHINIDFDDNDKNKCLLCQNEKVLFLSIETIKSLKHSKQLIDLIEIGDILKIKISEEWVEKQDTIKFIVVGQTYTITEIKECLENGLFKIIQILTKEQFEANCYKVGVEDNE